MNYFQIKKRAEDRLVSFRGRELAGAIELIGEIKKNNFKRWVLKELLKNKVSGVVIGKALFQDYEGRLIRETLLNYYQVNNQVELARVIK